MSFLVRGLGFFGTLQVQRPGTSISFLVRGMAPSGDVDEQAIDETLSVRERVLRDLRVTLQSIKATTPERSSRAEGNAAGVTHASGGEYTGTVTRRYRVSVVTGGASGVAAVTVTDATPSENPDGTPAPASLWPVGTAPDDGPVALVVSSGVPFAVGTLGVTMTLTWTGSLVAGNSWHVWAGPFRVNVGSVAREDDLRDPSSLSIVMRVPGEDNITGPLWLETSLMLVDLNCEVARDAMIGQQISEFLADVKEALRADVTRGGNAVNTTFLGNAGFALTEGKTGGGFDLRVQVQYRTSDRDPRALV